MHNSNHALNEKTSALKAKYDFVFSTLSLVILMFIMLSSVKQGYPQLPDAFFKKKFMIENYNRLRVKIGDRVFPNAIVGKNGWLEYTGGNNLDDYQNAVYFSNQDLEKIAQTINDCYQYAQAKDIVLLLVVAPNKASIYPEKLPDEIQTVSTLSRFDQLNDYLKKKNIPALLDLRPSLKKASLKQYTYYKYGTHWNEYGAYIAYETIIKELAENNLDITPYSSTFFRFRYILPNDDHRSDNGIAQLMQLNFVSPEPYPFTTRNLQDFVGQINFADEKLNYHKITWTNNDQLPTLLVFHDSFGNWGLNKFLAMNFSKASYINREASRLFLNQKAIEHFAPDVIIYEIVERNLNIIQDDLSGCAKQEGSSK